MSSRPISCRNTILFQKACWIIQIRSEILSSGCFSGITKITRIAKPLGQIELENHFLLEGAASFTSCFKTFAHITGAEKETLDGSLSTPSARLAIGQVASVVEAARCFYVLICIIQIGIRPGETRNKKTNGFGGWGGLSAHL